MKNWRTFSAIMLVLLLAVVACTGPGSAMAQGVSEGNRARGFTLETPGGEKVSLSDYEGSVVLVNFWATWCAPCKAEIPDLEAAYQAHSHEGFVVLGVNVEDSAQAVEPFVVAMDMTYPVVLDESGRVMKEYRAQGLPMSLIVDRDGVIRVRHVGYLSAGQLADYLAEVLP